MLGGGGGGGGGGGDVGLSREYSKKPWKRREGSVLIELICVQRNGRLT